MLGPFATASRRTPPVLHCHSPGVATVAHRHCRTQPAHRCPRQQRQRVTEGTAMAPCNGPNNEEFYHIGLPQLHRELRRDAISVTWAHSVQCNGLRRRVVVGGRRQHSPTHARVMPVFCHNGQVRAARR